MLEPILKKLEIGYQLIYEGKIEEALQLVNELDKEQNLTQDENLKCEMYKGIVFLLGWDLEKAFKVLIQVSRKSKDLGNVPLAIEAIFWEWWTRLHFSREIKGWEVIMDLENLLKSTKVSLPSKIEQSEFFLLGLKCLMYTDEGKLDQALETLKKNEEFLARSNTFELLISQITLFSTFGNLYAIKGELDLALKYHNMNLEFCKGKNSYAFKASIAFSLSQIGDIYYQQGEFNLAIEFYEKSLKIREQLNNPSFLSEIYYRFIKISLLENTPRIAKEYLKRFQEYLEREKISDNYASIYLPLHKISVAMILKSNKRISDRVEAERLLKESIKFYDNIRQMKIIIPFGVITNLGTSRYGITPIIELCDLYLQELDMMKNLEIIDDIQPLVERLLDESKRMNSFSLQAYSFLLQDKLSLLQMNMGDARQQLTQAQRIAEEHDLQQLARQISSEHDRLLELVEDLTQLERKKASVSERLNLASLDVTLDQLQGKRPLNPPDLINEEPILLLIMGQDGVSYFNHSFVDNWNFDDIFSSFMSAFNSFSSEIFAKSIDRIKIDENVILIIPVDIFLVCYVIKGQSYPALQKLTRFSDAIKWNTEISEALKRSATTGEELDLNNPPSLGEVVNEIFI